MTSPSDLGNITLSPLVTIMTVSPFPDDDYLGNITLSPMATIRQHHLSPVMTIWAVSPYPLW
jgi:hypothetical protein